MGVAGGRVWQEGRLEVWARPLDDGTWAAGLFNRGLRPYDVTVRWEDLGLGGAQPVRDLWQQKDMGVFDGAYTVQVPRHGAVMVRIGR
jgi:alpha-galactosidase